MVNQSLIWINWAVGGSVCRSRGGREIENLFFGGSATTALAVLEGLARSSNGLVGLKEGSTPAFLTSSVSRWRSSKGLVCGPCA